MEKRLGDAGFLVYRRMTDPEDTLPITVEAVPPQFAASGTQSPVESQMTLAALQAALPERYDVERFLGRGAFGQVFLARDKTLKRDVAIKILRLEHASPEKQRNASASFLREMCIMASLQHPNIPAVLDYGELKSIGTSPPGTPFATMPYYKGGSLDDYRPKQSDKKLSPEKAAEFVAQAADAVQFAHSHGPLHRDLKPQNIFLLDEDHICVGDWGLAADLDSLWGSQSNDGAGTLLYASPEQINGEPLTASSDIWALGVILYELLTGKCPFFGPDRVNIYLRISQAKFRPVRQCDGTISPGLEHVCHRCLRSVPAERHTTAGDLAKSLRDWSRNRRGASSQPFCLIGDAAFLGREDKPMQFSPRLKEYQMGIVHRPAVAEEVESRLLRDGFALVRGVGAAGKTVLAVTMALAPSSPFRNCLTYYVKLGESDVDDPVSAIDRLADGGVLFVVDDVHVDECLAARIHRRWSQGDRGSRLLMLGRYITRAPNARGEPEPLERLEEQSLILQVGPDDLAGVYHRLACRAKPGGDVGEPPHERLVEWCDIFGGTLIAFSAAVINRMPKLLCRDWQLSGRDAVAHVRKEYLDKDGTTEREREALLCLAATAPIEAIVTTKAVQYRDLEKYVDMGLVLYIDNRAGGIFTLVHPGFGVLLWDAAAGEMSRCRADVLREIAQRDYFGGALMAFCLKRLHEDEELAGLIDLFAQHPKELVCDCLRSGLGYFLAVFRIIGNRISTETWENAFHANRDQLIDAAFSTPLHDLVTFLRYAEDHLSAVHQFLAEELAAPGNGERLIDVSFTTPLHYLVTFLRYAEGDSSAVHQFLAEELAAPGNREPLIDVPFTTPCNDLVTFRRYAEDHLWAVHQFLAEKLAAPGNRERLIDAAFSSPLSHLSNFLRYARDGLREVYTTLANSLGDCDNRARLTEQIQRGGVEGLTAIMEHADEANLIDVQRNLAAIIAEPENCDAFGEWLSRQAVDHLSGAISRIPELEGPLRNCSAVTWESAYECHCPPVSSLLHAIRKLNSLGRQDLAEIVARTAVRSGKIGSNDPIVAVSYALNFGRAESNETRRRFLDEAVTDRWLKSQYLRCPLQSLAGALFGIGISQEEDTLARFHHPDLQRRLIREAYGLTTHDETAVSYFLQCVGSASLIGVALPRKSWHWLDDGAVASVVNWHLDRHETKEIDQYQIQLWLGLREAARVVDHPLTVPSDAGAQTLDLWDNAKPTDAREQWLNAEMTAWLKRCAQSGWTLLSQPHSIHRLLHGQP